MKPLSQGTLRCHTFTKNWLPYRLELKTIGAKYGVVCDEPTGTIKQGTCMPVANTLRVFNTYEEAESFFNTVLYCNTGRVI